MWLWHVFSLVIKSKYFPWKPSALNVPYVFHVTSRYAHDVTPPPSSLLPLCRRQAPSRSGPGEENAEVCSASFAKAWHDLWLVASLVSSWWLPLDSVALRLKVSVSAPTAAMTAGPLTLLSKLLLASWLRASRSSVVNPDGQRRELSVKV